MLSERVAVVDEALCDRQPVLPSLHDGEDEDAANEANQGELIESGLFPSIEGDLPFLLVPLKEMAQRVNGKNCQLYVPRNKKVTNSS